MPAVKPCRVDAVESPNEPDGEFSREQLEKPTPALTHFMEKLIGHRLNALVTDPQMLQVHQKFGGHVFRRSSIYHGLAKFLVQQQVAGDCCFEIGSWNGLTAIILARHFKKVVSVDIAHGNLKHKIAAELGINNIEFINIRDNAHKADIARRLCFDFAYVDGDHANDTQSDWELVNHCGRVLFHEAWSFQPPVWELLKSLDPRDVTYNGDGLALWRRNP